jgi:tetratricopeptide (TPR) repeat protein
LQTGLQLYNDEKHGQALAQFESIIQHDKSAVEAMKFAGISALRLGDYDKALTYFEELENYPGLQVNRGKIYHAITLMKRGKKGDSEKAKQLLNEVVQNNLEGKTQAIKWLRKF